jgi:CRP-like cAMP-binding protein
MPDTALSFDRGFLARLDPADRDRLFAQARLVHFADGEDILSAGEPSGDVYCLIEGRAEAALYSEQGRLVLYRDMLPGDIFGELALLDDGPRTAFVVARGAVRAAALSPRAFEMLLADCPGFARALLTHLASGIRRLTERIYEQTALNVRHRLLCELMRRAREEAGEAAESALIAPPPRHADIAAHIGTHREAVTKELSHLAREGLVVKERGGLRLPSLRAVQTAIGL